MSARDDYPPTMLLGGSATAYERLWAEIDELRSVRLEEFVVFPGQTVSFHGLTLMGARVPLAITVREIPS